VDHGETGFIVDSIEGAVEAVRKLGSIDRGRVRATFERRFSSLGMARRYVDVYRRLLAEPSVQLILGDGAVLDRDGATAQPLHVT